MALATYSAGSGVTLANSKTSLNDVLTLLPDNTIKEISPRDVRDAVFSTWENSPFRYTSNGTNDYIGIAREDVKDMTILLGKKQISGTNILSTGLATSDTDIFLFNTKLDSEPTQDFKMSFLAGSSSSIFQVAPYIRAGYVSGTYPYITLDIINPATYGTITLESGSSQSITINHLDWPSSNYVDYLVANPANASASTGTDLFLAVSAGTGNIELKTYASLGNTLGGPGQTVNIQGDPVNVNGYSLEFSNPNPILATFGGIGIGMSFSNVPLITMIEMMLYPYLGPLASVSFTGLSFNNSFERSNTFGNNLNFQYTVYKRTNNILTNNLALVQSNSGTIWTATGVTAFGIGLQNASGSGTVSLSHTQVVSIPSYPNNTLTFSCTVYDGTQSYTDYVKLIAVYPYYYGFSSYNVSTATTFKTDVLPSMSQRTDTKTNLQVALNGSGYLYFSYPKVYGTLSAIIDGNSFSEYTHGDFNTWTFSDWNINAKTGNLWTIQDYYVYKKNLTSTIYNQNYKFNF